MSDTPVADQLDVDIKVGLEELWNSNREFGDLLSFIGMSFGRVIAAVRSLESGEEPTTE